MALTDIDKVKLELGLNSFDEQFFTDDEIQYFLDKNNSSIRKASLDAAKTLLFMLAQYVHEKTAVELEIWGHSFFENYMEALKMYINDPNYSIAIQGAMPYAGGISREDAALNIQDTDAIGSEVESLVPEDYVETEKKTDPFDQSSTNRFGPFDTF